MNSWFMAKRTQMGLLGFVVILASFLFLFQLHKGAFWDYDEGTYAGVTKDTLNSGDLLTLKNGPTNWFEKPPLYFWAAMVSEKVFPSKEFAYRFPAAVTGILSVILVMLIVFALTENYLLAALAGMILLTSPPFLEAARQYRLDVPVTAAILFSFYSFIRGFKNEKWFAGVGVGIGIGVLFKSVIGFFPVIGLVVWTIVYWDISWIKSKYMWLGVLLSLGIIVPWHVYESLHYGMTFWKSYLLFHVVSRFEENILNIQVNESNWVYLSFLFTYGLPWTAVFLAFGPFLYWLRGKKENIKEILVPSFFVLAVVILFFNASTKINYYLIPIYPFIAISIALIVGKIYESSLDFKKFKARLPFLIGIFILIACANTIYVGYNHVHQFYINQAVSDDERTAALIIAHDTENLNVFTYNYEYWDTLKYYSGKNVEAMHDDQVIDTPFFLIVHTEAGYVFPDEIQKSLTTLFHGQSLTLYKFTPPKS